MPGADKGCVWSHCCGFEELVAPYAAACGEALDPRPDWASRWTATWRVGGDEIVCAVRDLAMFPWGQAQPVRAFSWRPGQRHRPGLAFMQATGRGHGFESLAERRTLTVLDFCGGVRDVLSQPFSLRFFDSGRRREHIPDFLVATAKLALLIDVRPAHLVKESDVTVFAATARVAACAGWRYQVVTGWRGGVVDAVEALTRGRRPRIDPRAVLQRSDQVEGQAPPPEQAQQMVPRWHRPQGRSDQLPEATGADCRREQLLLQTQRIPRLRHDH